MKRTRQIAIYLVAAAVLLAGCAGGGDEAASGDDLAALTIPVRTIALETADFVVFGEYYGEVRGISEADLVSISGGTVDELLYSEGDTVSTGDSLGRVDGERAATMYETSLLNERLALQNYEREQRFLNEGNSFQVKVDDAHLRWLQAKSALLDAQKVRDSALIISPIDGTVVARHVELHQEIAPGMPTYSVADLTQMRITVGIPEADIAGVRELDRAYVTVGAFPNRVWEGSPESFARKRSDNTLTFDVDIVIDNPDQLLLSGQTAQVRLALREYADQIVVPSSTVATRGNRPYVLVVESDRVYERTVTIVAADERSSAIRGDIKPGDLIVTEGMNRLTDGDLVEVVGAGATAQGMDAI